jgi:hypothetical protein
MANKLIVILAAIIFIGGCVGSFFFGRATKDTSIVSTKVERDTIIIRDTVRESYPAAVDKKKVGSVAAKAPVVATPAKDKARDTVYIRDTVWVELSMEEREYKGKDYRAVVGGYNPYLKSIEVYPTTKYINTTETIKKRKRWGFSVGAQGGYGYTPRGFQPYVGFGFSFGYNF